MSKRQYFIFPLFLALYEIAVYLTNDMYLPALPQMTESLNITREVAALSLTTWFMGSASMQLILGPVADHFGRRSVLLSGGLFFVLASLICAITNNILLLLIARFIQGCVIAAVVVPGYASIHELFDQKNAIKTLSWMNSITVLAPAFGPICGSAILIFGTWRTIFWILALYAAFCLIVLYYVMPETNPEKHPLHFKRSFHHYILILKNLAFMKNSLAFSFLFCGLIIWIVISPFLIIIHLKESTLAYGLYQVYVFSSFILGTRAVKYIIDKHDIQVVIKWGLMISLLGGFGSLLVSIIFPDTFPYLLVGIMIYAMGCGLCFGPLSRIAIEASTQPMGARMAIFSGIMGVLGVLGSALGTAFYTGTFLSLAWMLFVLAIFAAILKLR